MVFVEYKTPIAQEDYLMTGLVGAILGFFLLAYFFMYFSYHVATKSHTRLTKDPSKLKLCFRSCLPHCLALESHFCF